MGRCEGQVAVVTGSSSGIGEAVARRFAAEGAHVVVNSATSVDAGRAVADSLPSATYVQADVSTPAGAQAVVAAAVDAYGRLDHLVNNAGWTRVVAHDDIAGADLELWRRVFEVNVFGTWLVCQAAIEHLRADGGGSITNMTSLAGVRAVGSSIPYACSKAALNHQTELLAKVVGPDVRVNAVAPGLVATPWTADWEAQAAGVSAIAPLRRVGTPDDIADVTVALATSSYVTGQIVVVDGGLGLVV